MRNGAKSTIVRAAAAGLNGLGGEVSFAGQNLAARPGDNELVILRYRGVVNLCQPVAEKIAEKYGGDEKVIARDIESIKNFV